MKYFLITVVALCCLTEPLSAQPSRKNSERCSVKRADAPKARGFFLGQEELRASTVAESYQAISQPLGVSDQMVVIPGVLDKTKATERDSARWVIWELHKNKISGLRLHYLGYTPKDLLQFVQDYSRGENLPEGIFRFQSEYKAEAECDGFWIYLFTAPKIDERTRQVAVVEIVDRRVVKIDDRSYFDKRLEESKRQREELRRNPRKIINPGGPVVGPPN